MDTLPHGLCQDFYPAQAAVVAFLPAFLPYALVRELFRRIARHLDRPANVRLIDGPEGTAMATPNLKFDANTELAARRTGMAFQRTRMSADRTLMSVIRTSLSLIGFGFTIAQVFQKLKEQALIKGAAPGRNFGLALIGLGVAMLVIGIGYHVQFMIGLRKMRESMRQDGLVHAESVFPVSLTLITAALLLLIGVAAVVSVAFQVGPFE